MDILFLIRAYNCTEAETQSGVKFKVYSDFELNLLRLLRDSLNGEAKREEILEVLLAHYQ